MASANGAFTEKTRALIKARADGRCEKCGIRIEYGGQIHHRRPRGMGGTRRKEASCPSNGLYVHLKCHGDIESNRKRAYYMGWLVGVGRQTESAEVRLWDGWFILTAEGGRLPYGEPPDPPDD